MSIFPPDLRNGRKFASSALMCPKLDCRIRPWSYAFANCAYDRLFQPLAPLPVALMNDGVASIGFCSSSATRSVAMVKGPGPPRPPKLLPRASPYQRWLPVPMCSDQALSADGGGAVPSRVWPYHSLFIACACSGVTQLAVGLVPPLATQITLASSVGAQLHPDGFGVLPMCWGL